jgi:hypothetical protein
MLALRNRQPSGRLGLHGKADWRGLARTRSAGLDAGACVPAPLRGEADRRAAGSALHGEADRRGLALAWSGMLTQGDMPALLRARPIGEAFALALLPLVALLHGEAARRKLGRWRGAVC